MKLWIMGCALAAGAAMASAAQAASCDRTCMTGLIDKAETALTTGQAPAGLFAPKAKITQNGEAIDVAASAIKGAKPGGYHRYFVDGKSEQAGFYGVLDEADRQAVLLLRIKVADRRITELEAIFAHKGEASIASPETMATAVPVGGDDILPKEHRRSRAQLIAAANAYFDGIPKGDGSKVPATADCQRYENGAQTTRPPTAPGALGGCRGSHGSPTSPPCATADIRWWTRSAAWSGPSSPSIFPADPTRTTRARTRSGRRAA